MHQQLEGTMWLPESDLGVMNGWLRREAEIDWDVYMKMHYRIIGNLIENGTPPDSQEVATFYWFVKNTEGSGWWRYPGWVLRVGDFSNPSQLDTLGFTIDPTDGAGNTFTLVDDDFEENPPTETATSHAYGSGPLDEELNYHGFGALWGTPVRMSIFYHGRNHTFQIYNVQVWDEGYDRLFSAPDSIRQRYADTIRTAFQNQRNSVGDTVFAGWYYDEWPQGPTMHQYEPVKSFVKVNQILQGHVPTMVVNGHQGYPGCDHCFRNYLFGEENSQNVTLPVHMDEFYFLGGSRNCQANWEYNYTDYASDVTYFNYGDCERSLQCAIDQYIWGDSALVEAPYGLTLHSDYANSSLLAQVSFVHDSGRGARFWSLIQGDDDAADDDTVWSSIRTPSPNEAKLGAWLSVACDVDGILWYPVKFGAGLLGWNPDQADACGGALRMACRQM
jgi:hypothetical protein